MRQYLDLLAKIKNNGSLKKTRAGDTISLFNQNLSHKMEDGFPLLTSKKIDFRNIVLEMCWFLSGDPTPTFLHKHGIHFWDAWIEDNGARTWDNKPIKFLPRAYGEYWRDFPCDESGDIIDQFKAIIDGLKKDPNNRRLVLDRWYAPVAWTEKLPPCFFASVFNVQYKNGQQVLNLANMGRSVDFPVGAPYNLSGFALLLSLVSHLTDIVPGEISLSMVDCHIYSNQIDGVNEQLKRIPKTLPRLSISPNLKTLQDLDQLIKDGTTQQILDTFQIEGYNPDPFIKFPISV